MTKILVAAVVAGLALAGCGGSSSNDSPGTSGSGGSGGGTGGSGGGSGGSGGGSGGTGGSTASTCVAPKCDCNNCYATHVCQGDDHSTAVDACTDTTLGLQTVRIDMDSFDVEPGGEVYMCQNFKNPFGGTDTAIAASESYMSQGSHHMFAFYNDTSTDGALESCSGLEFHRSIHTAQEPYTKFQYPTGVGALIKGTEGVRMNAHYINTSNKTLTAHVSVVLYVAKPGTVSSYSAQIFFNNPAILVGPHATGHATKTCNIPSDVKLFGVSSHMHQFGTHFTATTDDGRSVYETDTWDNPEVKIFDPPMDLATGSSITYTCDYNNPTSSTLTFGDSAYTNEMCILSGRYFPAADGATIDCLY